MGDASLSLDALCWQLGLRCNAKGGLLPQLRLDANYKLIGWPDFGAIGIQRFGLKLAAEMSMRSASPSFLAEKLQLKIEDVIGFVNAAAVSGLLLADQSATTQKAPPVATAAAKEQAPRVSMFSRLRAKLGLS